MSIEDRVARLERGLLSLAILITGEAGTPEEAAVIQQQFAEDFDGMKAELKA